MVKQYTYLEDNEPTKVSEDVSAYPQSITIPITLPTTGSYSVEYLKKELTDFAVKLLRHSTPHNTSAHISWRSIAVSDRVKSMSLGPSKLSTDTRSDKELLEEALEEKYRWEYSLYAALAARWNDGEDCIQYQSALSAGCDYILTRNKKDFALSTIPAMTPEEFLDNYYS